MVSVLWELKYCDSVLVIHCCAWHGVIWMVFSQCWDVWYLGGMAGRLALLPGVPTHSLPSMAVFKVARLPMGQLRTPSGSVLRGPGGVAGSLASGVPQCHFCCILLVKHNTKVSPDSRGRRLHSSFQSQQWLGWAGRLTKEVTYKLRSEAYEGWALKIQGAKKKEEGCCELQLANLRGPDYARFCKPGWEIWILF